MSAPKIASLFGLVGASGLIIAVLIGTSEWTDDLLDASFICLVFAGLTMLLYVLVNLWKDFSGPGDLHRPRA
jgi:hypothetical protein